MASKQTIEISTGIVLRTLLIVIAIWILYLIRDVIALVFISIILASTMDPIIYRMQRRKIPRPVGVFAVYLCLLAVLSIAVSFIIPPLVNQFQEFTQKLPDIAQKLENTFQGVNAFFQAQHLVVNVQSLLAELGKKLAETTGGIFTATLGIFNGFLSAVIVLVMTFYMAVKEDGIKNFVVSITPDKHKAYVGSLELRIQRKIGRWMLGQVALMFIIFIMNFVALSILKVPYALTLSIFAGLLEIVPFIGPIVAAIPSVLVGLSISPLTGLLVLITYVFIQQFEGHIIIPQIMKKAVGLHPIAVIVALLIGLKLGGVLGALLAIPVATAVSVFLGDLMREENPLTE